MDKMTDPSEVTVTDEELSALCTALHTLDPEPGTDWHKRCKQILAEFIAQRVPDAMDGDPNSHHYDYDAGHNACRARVLNGE
jgi:hypothetical protein